MTRTKIAIHFWVAGFGYKTVDRLLNEYIKVDECALSAFQEAFAHYMGVSTWIERREIVCVGISDVINGTTVS